MTQEATCKLAQHLINAWGCMGCMSGHKGGRTELSTHEQTATDKLRGVAAFTSADSLLPAESFCNPGSTLDSHAC